MELELQGGPVDDLFALALLLVERHPLMLDNRSKAERGSRLALGAVLEPPAKAAALTAPQGKDARAAARLAVETSLAHWQANEAGFLSQPQGGHYDSEYLHQLRVAVRRLRVACGLLARAAQWQQEALMPLQDSLRALSQRLGAARDWDVFIEETWPPLADSLHDAALRQKLQEAAALLQATARLQAQAALEERDTQHLLLQLGRRLAQPDSDAPGLPLAVLAAQLEKLNHRLRQSASSSSMSSGSFRASATHSFIAGNSITRLQ